MFLLNVQSKDPIFQQIRDQLRAFIGAGVIKEGDKLPSVRQLARDNGINPNTVAKAYRELEELGVIYTLPKKGAYVHSSGASSHPLDRTEVTPSSGASSHPPDRTEVSPSSDASPHFPDRTESVQSATDSTEQAAAGEKEFASAPPAPGSAVPAAAGEKEFASAPPAPGSAVPVAAGEKEPSSALPAPGSAIPALEPEASIRAWKEAGIAKAQLEELIKAIYDNE